MKYVCVSLSCEDEVIPGTAYCVRHAPSLVEHSPAWAAAPLNIASPEPSPSPSTSPSPSPTVQRAVKFLERVGVLLVEKNKKYGDAAASPMRVFSKASPIEQVLVRIDDKLSRISKGAGLLATDEDVVQDLVGYLALLAALLEDK